MSEKKFKFVSPGVFVDEIDNSQTTKTPLPIGPVIIGRTERGPGMRPVKVESFSEFVNIFGNPIPGGQGGDVWRDGNYMAPTYASYAAQAWLKNNSPCTIVRLLGTEHENKTSAGKAGWETRTTGGASNSLNATDGGGGAYGLFIIDSGSDTIGTASGDGDLGVTGSLAAVFYFNEGNITLSGSLRTTGSATTGSTAAPIKSIGANKEFRALIRNSAGTIVKTTTFNFNRNSQKYIRKVFNTNPILTNNQVSTGENTASYWLGETYEKFLDTQVTGGSGQNYGIILGLAGPNAADSGVDFRYATQEAKSGWFFGQDLQSVTGAANSYQPETMTKLFRFHCLDTGEWSQKNLKISIADIKISTNQSDPYGTFSVVIRKTEDSDNAVRIVERYSNCNLNPNSVNYVAKKIGDGYIVWDDEDRRYREYGNHGNNSKFVRIEMNSDVEAGGINAELLPFGVYGPPRFKGFTLLTGEDYPQTLGAGAGANDFTNAFVKGTQDIARSAAPTGEFFFNGDGSSFMTASFIFPALAIRSSSIDGNLANPQEAYFGLDTSITRGTTRFDPGYNEYVRSKPAAYDSYVATSGKTEYSWIFTLDDLAQDGVHGVYVSGSRAAGTSVTARSADNYKAILDAGFDKFTSPMFGGFDGLDIAEKEPFNNTDLESGTETTNYSFNSVKRAMDTVADPEVVECNLMTMPGLTHEGLTSHLLNVCEDRQDTLGIIDLKGGYIPSTENTNGDNSSGNRGSVDTTISNLNNRGINTSYGCAYYPWVQAKDTINGNVLWVPPSIAALGTMAFSEKNSELWFAPAGFTRGGLTEGSAGIPIINVREKLTSKQRDKLYAANINPIASFPAEGIVIFGQKTLQVTPSALDRVNVRRLMIFVKKEISRMAATILFDQNVSATWNRFLSKVKPFLRSVQIRLGLTDFKVILDETTTTPDLIDRNILYAKIFLKPARAIEFIALDFNITDSGASFAE